MIYYGNVSLAKHIGHSEVWKKQGEVYEVVIKIGFIRPYSNFLK